MLKVYIKLALEALVLFTLLFLIVLGMAIFTPAAGQCTMTHQPQKATKWSQSKDGTVATKTCLYWSACPNMEVVEFRATATSAVTLYKITDSVYQDLSDKVWKTYMEDGLRVFHSGKKAFYYKP